MTFANGGVDLESVELDSIVQGAAMLKQVCYALAVAEAGLKFEHRDLHWGNVLLRPCTEDQLEYVLDGKTFTTDTHGIFANVIDFTLSRIDTGDEVLFQDLEQDPEIFDGEGDLQFDCYRSMRKAVKRDWSSHAPRTNLYWIRYLADKLLNEKEYSCTPLAADDAARESLMGICKRAVRYRSVTGLLKDKFFQS